MGSTGHTIFSHRQIGATNGGAPPEGFAAEARRLTNVRLRWGGGAWAEEPPCLVKTLCDEAAVDGNAGQVPRCM